MGSAELDLIKASSLLSAMPAMPPVLTACPTATASN
jgi:hypothetical protein